MSSSDSLYTITYPEPELKAMRIPRVLACASTTRAGFGVLYALVPALTVVIWIAVVVPAGKRTSRKVKGDALLAAVASWSPLYPVFGREAVYTGKRSHCYITAGQH